MNTAGIIPGLTGAGEVLVLVVAILVLFFGAKRLPELSRALGKSMNEFKKGREEGAHDTPEEKKPEDGPQAAETSQKEGETQ